ncbi:MAG: response regulator [Cellvibrionaceae bacterium]
MVSSEKNPADIFDEKEGTIELFAYGQKKLDIEKPKRPLNIVLPLSTFLLIVSIIGVLIYLFFYEGKKIVVSKEIKELYHSDKLVDSLIEQFYKNNKKNIEFLVQSNDFKSNHSKDYRPLFLNYLNSNYYYNSIMVVDNRGNLIYGLKRDTLSLDDDFLQMSDSIDSLFNKTKKVFHYSSGEVYFSDVYKLGSGKKLGLNAAAVIPQGQLKNNKRFAIFVNIDFTRFLNDTVLTGRKNMSLYLFDYKGDYLLNPGFLSFLTGDNIKSDLGLLSNIIDDNVDYHEFSPNQYAEFSYPAVYSLMNLSHFGAEQPLRSLLVYSDIDHFKDVEQISKYFIYIGLALAFIAFVLTWFITRYLLNPLLKMSDAIKSYEEVGAIDLLPVDAPDEIGTLAKSFHNLFKNKEEREIELIKARNYIDGITNEAPVLLSYIDKTETYQFVNHCYELWSGKPSEKIVGLRIEDLLGSESYRKLKPYVDRALQGEVVQFKSEVDYNGNQSRHVQLTYTPQRDTCNNVQGFYVCVEDITQNTLASQKIRDLSQRLDIALDAPGIGVWDYDLATGELYWDERMHHIYHMLETDFSNDYDAWSSRLHPDDIERVNSNFDYTLKTQHEFVDEFRIIWPNKETRWISAHGCVICDEYDQPIRIIGTNMDITGRKNLEIEREQALIKAEESAQLKSAFLASMSHEIRTPMNGVLGMLGLIKNTTLNKQQTHYLGLANSSAESLLTLINDILDFSKVEAGKMDLDIIDFDLPDMLGSFCESIAHRAQEKGIEVILDITGITCTYVKGDPGRLRQVLNNLAANAIKFTEAGEVTISVQLIQCQTGGLRLDGVVSDTGIGIPESKLDRLFDSFSQVDASTTRKYGGTGLGLAIVKQLCELMGGDVSAISTLGKGSQFIFNLALEQSEQSELLMPSVDIKGTRILLVDDNKTNLTVLTRQLHHWGAEVYECTSGDDALTLLNKEQNQPFDIAILDMQMPGMNGEQLAQHIAEIKQCASMKMVMMTSLSHRGDAKRLADLGFSAFFPKPATANDLFGALAILLDDSAALSSARPLLTHHHIRSIEKNAEEISKASAANSEFKREEKDRVVHILLVEDNLINQEVALGILECLGLTADVANHGLEALEKLNQKYEQGHAYDLILMDCQMPEMDGYEATRAIRAGKTFDSNIPIIAMTANAMKGDKEKCLSVGMDDYISKPIDPQKLSTAIKHWAAISLGSNTSIQHEDLNSMSTDDNEVWNREEFMNRIMNNTTIAQKLFDLFKTDTPKTIEQLAVAVQAQQAHEAGLLAHKLKGSVSNLGGIELASLAQKIELAGKSEDMSEVESLWPDVQPQYDKLLHQIEQRL